MQPVTADKGKESREERAALWIGPGGDHPSELPYLQCQERGSQHEGDESSQTRAGIAPLADRHGHQSAGVTRRQKAAGLDRDTALAEQLHTARTAGRRMREPRVSGKDRRKHDDVAEEKAPEPISDHDPLRRRPRLACAQFPNVIFNCNSDVHTAISAWFACSNRAICSAGISTSSSLRKAKASTVRKIPINATPAIHQMRQIRAKPETTEKNAVMKPVALFFGISIDSNFRSFGDCACCARSRCFRFQSASMSVTRGSTAKFQAGGGEAVAHSSVRPFHGSAATFNCSRLRIETTS